MVIHNFNRNGIQFIFVVSLPPLEQTTASSIAIVLKSMYLASEK